MTDVKLEMCWVTSVRRFTLAICLVVHASVAIAQSQDIEASDAWCQKTLWDPVAVPQSDLASVAKSAGPLPNPVYTLSLSGGGYRAMLFHVGTLHRLNDARLLSKLTVVSSVSGGSITAAVLAHRWEQLNFDDTGFATNLSEVLDRPLRNLASQTVSWPSVLVGLLPFTSAPERLSNKLDTILFATNSQRKVRLADIAPGQVGNQKVLRPAFIFLATNLQTGELWQLRANAIGGPQTGWIAPGEIALSDAVVASAGFPPFFAPLKLNLLNRSGEWTQCWENKDNPFGADPQYEPTRAVGDENREGIRTKIYLADGGIRDNLGVSAIQEINRVRRIRAKSVDPISTVNFISDGGAATALNPHPSSNWFGVFSRVTGLMSDQPNDLRVGQIVRTESKYTLDATDYSDFLQNPCGLPNKSSVAERNFAMRRYLSRVRGDSYAYWSIRKLPKVHEGMHCPEPSDFEWMREEVRTLASEPTNLAALKPQLQVRLINWGYLSAHHGMPYINALIAEASQLKTFIEGCKMPFGPADTDPKFDTPSARQSICLPYQTWDMYPLR